MDDAKFQSELGTLTGFVELFCRSNKHQEKSLQSFTCNYHGFSYSFEIFLCSECRSLLNYASTRLQKCPHEIKPKCRKCKVPCYEKKEWKQMAKVMRYGGITMAIEGLKERFFTILKTGKKR